MRVLIVNSVCGTGSTGKICTDLYDELEKEGYECCIAYGRGEANSRYNTYKIGTKKDVYIHYAFSRIFGSNGLHSTAPTKKFISFIDSYNPDLIHLHNIHGYYLNYEVLFMYLKNIFKGKIIWTLHDCWSFSGGDASIDYDENGKFIQEKKGILGNSGYPKAIINRSSKNLNQKRESFTGFSRLTIVTPSNWLRNMVEKTFLSDNEVLCIHNGIDLEKFKIIENKILNGERKKILAVASIWTKSKGIEDIVEMASHCQNYDFTIVGKTRKTKKSSNISFIDRTDSFDELIKLYNQADVFINPTYLDNFPTTNLESLACGTPVVTYSTGGSSEAISSECGITCEYKTVEELEKAVKLVFKEMKDGTSFSFKQCRKRAELFDKSSFVKSYIKVYEN